MLTVATTGGQAGEIRGIARKDRDDFLNKLAVERMSVSADEVIMPRTSKVQRNGRTFQTFYSVVCHPQMMSLGTLVGDHIISWRLPFPLGTKSTCTPSEVPSPQL